MGRNWLWMVLVVVGIVAVIWWVRRGVDGDGLLNLGDSGTQVNIPTGMEKDFEDAGLVISEGAEKLGLEDVTGGSSRGSASVEKEGVYYVHYVVADLPELTQGFYEGWLVNSTGDVLYTGKLESRKGGWVLEYRTEKDISGYKKVVITEELVDDQKPEKHILEGSL